MEHGIIGCCHSNAWFDKMSYRSVLIPFSKHMIVEMMVHLLLIDHYNVQMMPQFVLIVTASE
jgi:hypothetical protein